MKASTGRKASYCGGRLSRRVVRGGSFDNNQNNVRCAYRNRNNPDNRNNNVGFRIVRAHGFLPNVFRTHWARILRRLRLAQRGGRPVQPVPGRVRYTSLSAPPLLAGEVGRGC